MLSSSVRQQSEAHKPYIRSTWPFENCDNSPRESFLRGSTHRVRKHLLTAPHPLLPSDLSASRGADDRIGCPLCSKSYQYTSNWGTHVKACAKAKEERERGELQPPPLRRTPSVSDARSVYGMDIDDSTGTEGKAAQPQSNSTSTPSSSSTNQLPPTPLSLPHSFGPPLSTSPSNAHALPPPPPQFNPYSSLAGPSNGFFRPPYNLSISQAPSNLLHQPASPLLSPFDQSNGFTPYYSAPQDSVSAVLPSSSSLGASPYSNFRSDLDSILGLSQALDSDLNNPSPTSSNSLYVSLSNDDRLLAHLEEQRHQQNERLGDELISLRTEKSSLVKQILEAEHLLAAENEEVERAEALRVERQEEENERIAVKKLEVEHETEKSLREDADSLMPGLEVKVAELEVELAGLGRARAAGEGTRREEEDRTLELEVEVLEREIAEIKEERKQTPSKEHEMECLRFENEEMKKRIAELDNPSSLTDQTQPSPSLLASRDSSLPPSSNFKRPVTTSHDHPSSSNSFKHPKLSEEELSISTSSRSPSTDAPARRRFDSVDQKFTRGRPQSQIERNEFDRFWTSNLVVQETNVCSTCSKTTSDSDPLPLSSDETTRISEIVLHLETKHRAIWKRICDPPSGD